MLICQWQSDWIMCGVGVIELQKLLCRIGDSSSVVVIASWSWSFKNSCRLSGKKNPGSKHCLRADAYLYQMCRVWRTAPRDGWYISSYIWKRC